MKKIIFLMLILSNILLANNVTLTLDGIREEKGGSIYIGLFTETDDFKEMLGAYRGSIVDVDSDTVTITFNDLPTGTYAISLFHDVNNTGELNVNVFGVPKEGYGFSNNPKVKFRAPNFEESKFLLNKDINIDVKVVY